MAYDYDAQLIESVSVRRTRLTSALIFGQNPLQRRWIDIIKMFLFSVAAAALLAAICVGYSFITNMLAEQRAEQRQRSQSAPIIQLMDIPTTESQAIHG
jgi:hypothetical protein